LGRPEDWARRIIEISRPDQYLSIIEDLCELSGKYSIESAKIKFGEIYRDLMEKTSKADS